MNCFRAQEEFQYPESSSHVNMGTKYSEVIRKLRLSFDNGLTKPLEFRMQQLKSLLRLLDENEERLADSMMQDLKKPKFESAILEIEYVRNDIRGVLQNLKAWAKPQHTKKNLVLLFDQSFVLAEPYGLVLVIGAWNYPVQLTLSPLVGAIAAGNCVLLKPSEVSPCTASTLDDLLSKYLDQNCYQTITGGVEDSTQLLKEHFDYIFYTGSTNVGKIVSEAANKYLTPVTLELGGKSPVYLDETVNMEIASKRILWGKFLNVGQTCVAPDYILCTEETQKKFVEVVRKTLAKFFSDSPKNSPDLARIVNDKQFQRLSKIINSGTAAIGGGLDPSQRYIEPTVLINVKADDPVMQEEIFGPILPIVTVKGPHDAVEFINNREKALSLYVFTTRQEVIDLFLKNTSSGSLCVNDTVVHLSIDELPFGGVGSSGMGKYHGRYSFQTFSHQKAVLIRNYNVMAERIGSCRYPPFSDRKLHYIQRLLKKRASYIPCGTSYFLVFVLGFVAAVLVKVIYDAGQCLFHETLP